MTDPYRDEDRAVDNEPQDPNADVDGDEYDADEE